MGEVTLAWWLAYGQHTVHRCWPQWGSWVHCTNRVSPDPNGLIATSSVALANVQGQSIYCTWIYSSVWVKKLGFCDCSLELASVTMQPSRLAHNQPPYSVWDCDSVVRPPLVCLEEVTSALATVAASPACVWKTIAYTVSRCILLRQQWLSGTWIQGTLTGIAKATKYQKLLICEPGSESRFSALRGESCTVRPSVAAPESPPAALHPGDLRQAHYQAVSSFLDHRSCESWTLSLSVT